MSNTIWKYALEDKSVKISMPLGAQLLSAGVDPEGNLCVWALVSSELPKTHLAHIRVFGTGVAVPPRSEIAFYRFLGTAVMSDGNVHHVFEVVDGGES
jgi:hypothetical protein